MSLLLQPPFIFCLGGGKRSPIFPPSLFLLLLLPVIKSFPFVLTWLEVSLAFLTSFEVLSVVLYDLFFPKPQSLHQGSTSAPVIFSIMLSTFSSMSLAGFVKVLRLDFFKSRSTLFQWIQPSTRHCTTAYTVAPASRCHRPKHHTPSTHRRVVLINLHAHPSSVSPTVVAAGFWVFLLLYVYYLGYCNEIWCVSFTFDPFDLIVFTLQQPPSKGDCHYLAGFWVVPGTFYDPLPTVFLNTLHLHYKFLLGLLWENPSLF